MKPHFYHPLAALLLGAAALPAQQKLDARAFLPQHYQAEFFADLEAMRECEFLDELERSVAFRMLRTVLRDEAGIDLADLHRVRIAGSERSGGEARDGSVDRVTILEGSDELVLPEATETRVRGEIAGVAVLREPGFAQDVVWASPKPGLLVFGSSTAVEPTLQGERRGGVPHPDLMALTAVRTPLLHVAAARCGMETGLWVKLMGFPDDWVSDEDPVETALLRVELVEGEMVAMAELRFAKGVKGPEVFAAGVRDALAMLDAEPAVAAVAGVLKKVEVTQPEGGLTLRLKLGSPRQAGQHVAQLLTPMAFLMTAPVAAQPFLVEPEAVITAPASEQAEKPEKKTEESGKTEEGGKSGKTEKAETGTGEKKQD